MASLGLVKVILELKFRKAWMYLLLEGRGNVIDATLRNIIASQKLDNFKVVIITSLEQKQAQAA